MKRIINIIFLIMLILIVIYGFMGVFPNYWGEHSNYYIPMLKNFTNRKILLTNFLISFLIVLFVLFFRRKVLTLLIGSFFSLLIFGWFYISYKGGFIQGKGGFVWLINLILMFCLFIIFISGIITLGDYIKRRIFKLDTKDIFGVTVNFGLGLSIFLLLNYILILFNLVYTILSWIVLISLCIFTIRKRDILLSNIKLLEHILRNFDIDKFYDVRILTILLLATFSLMYLNFGFLMSWIPYPTAWDANHAYMFYPKMWALHHGFYWNETNMNTTPYLWLAYITFWFSLFVPFYDSFWISPDTFAIVMNFFSGLFVLFLGLALIWEVLNLVKNIIDKNINNKFYSDISGFFYLGWFFLLLWLTSGMGAFLVFVDNKTDLGVLSLIILALYGGFLAYRKLIESDKLLLFSKDNYRLNLDNILLSYLILSAFFFAIAVASKPTAFFDVVNFGIFVITNFLSVILAIGLVLVAIGLLAILKFRGIVNYFTPEMGKKILEIGLGLSLLGVLEVFLRKMYKKVYPLVVWGVFFVIFLILIKGLWLVLELIYYPERFHSVSQIVMTLFFG